MSRPDPYDTACDDPRPAEWDDDEPEAICVVCGRACDWNELDDLCRCPDCSRREPYYDDRQHQMNRR